MTIDEFPDYRNRVLAKTNGANVHKVNGLLGVILNSVHNAQYFNSIDDVVSLSVTQARINQAMMDIRILTSDFDGKLIIFT